MKKIVFTYHRVGNTRYDYNNTCVSKENFEQQIIYINRHFKVLSMEDFLEYSGDETVATVTFDDGYKDTVNTVLPIIEKYSVPITIFVTYHERDGTEFWMSDIIRLIFEGEFKNGNLSFEINGEKIFLTVKDIIDRYNTYYFFRRLFREQNKEFRENVLEALHKQTNMEWKSRAEFCPLDKEDICNLSKHELVDIGAHTIEHVSLAKFSEEIQRKDIENSIEMIKRVTGKKIEYFAYPFGNAEDINEITIKILKENGIRAAFTTKSKVIDETDNEFLLPRINCENNTVEIWKKHVKHKLGLIINDGNENFCGSRMKDDNIKYADKIVICGSGNKLQDVIGFLERIGRKDRIVAVVDNDKNKQNKTIDGCLIFSYEEMYGDDENHWIICNRYDYDIFFQLRNNSIGKIHWWID